MEKWMKGRYMANQKRLSVGTGVPAPRGRGIVMLILLALVVALAVVSVTTVAKLSSVNSRNIAMMQEQCRDAVALSTTLRARWRSKRTFLRHCRNFLRHCQDYKTRKALHARQCLLCSEKF